MLGSDEENNVTTALSGETVKEQSSEATTSSASNTAAVATGVAAATTAAALATTHHNSTATSSTVKSDDKKEDTTAPAHSTQRDIASRKKLPLRDHRVKKEVVRHHVVTPKKEVKHRVHHTNEYRPPVKKKTVTHKIPTKTHIAEEHVATKKGYYIKVGAFKDPSNAIKRITK